MTAFTDKEYTDMIQRLCLVVGLLTCIRNRQIAVTAGILGKNVALNRQGKVSFLFQPHYPSLALDGDLNTDSTGAHCSFTFDNPYNGNGEMWFQVDLGDRYRLGDIRLLNNEESYERKLHDITVEVSDQGEEPRQKKVCTRFQEPAAKGWLNLTCSAPTTGRYVRIKKHKRKKDDGLILCEVEIYPKREKLRSDLSVAAVSGTFLIGTVGI